MSLSRSFAKSGHTGRSFFVCSTTAAAASSLSPDLFFQSLTSCHFASVFEAAKCERNLKMFPIKLITKNRFEDDAAPVTTFYCQLTISFYKTLVCSRPLFVCFCPNNETVIESGPNLSLNWAKSFNVGQLSSNWANLFSAQHSGFKLLLYSCSETRRRKPFQMTSENLVDISQDATKPSVRFNLVLFLMLTNDNNNNNSNGDNDDLV